MVTKITPKIVEEIVSEVAGEDVIPLVKALSRKSNVSEFKLADSIKKEINQARNMLYRLYDNNLVSFSRKKDKKKGWYIYYWTFNENRIRDLAVELKKKKVDKLQERLTREKSTQFYMCKNSCMRLDFEQSHDFQFKCPECGTLLDIDDNSKKIADIERDLAELTKEVKEPKVREAKPQKPVKAKPVKIKSKVKPKKKK